MEQLFHSNLTSAILHPDADTCPHPREIKEVLKSRDRDLRLAQHVDRMDMSTVVEVERAIGWPRLCGLRTKVHRRPQKPGESNHVPIPCRVHMSTM